MSRLWIPPAGEDWVELSFVWMEQVSELWPETCLRSSHEGWAYEPRYGSEIHYVRSFLEGITSSEIVEWIEGETKKEYFRRTDAGNHRDTAHAYADALRDTGRRLLALDDAEIVARITLCRMQGER